MKCVGYNQKRVGKSGSIFKWMVIVLTSSLYFFYFFYVIRLAGTNEPGPTSNRREGVYTHKQYAINSNCLSNEEIIPLIKKCNHFFFNKSPRETTHLSKNKANHKINSKMVKCNVKQLIYSGESNKNNIHNMCIKIKTIRQFTTKLSLSYCITYLNPIVDTNQIKPKVLKYSYLQGLAINSTKQNKSKDEINNIILINKNDRLGVLRCFCTSPSEDVKIPLTSTIHPQIHQKQIDTIPKNGVKLFLHHQPINSTQINVHTHQPYSIIHSAHIITYKCKCNKWITNHRYCTNKYDINIWLMPFSFNMLQKHNTLNEYSNKSAALPQGHVHTPYIPSTHPQVQQKQSDTISKNGVNLFIQTQTNHNDRIYLPFHQTQIDNWYFPSSIATNSTRAKPFVLSHNLWYKLQSLSLHFFKALQKRRILNGYGSKSVGLAIGGIDIPHTPLSYSYTLQKQIDTNYKKSVNQFLFFQNTFYNNQMHTPFYQINTLNNSPIILKNKQDSNHNNLILKCNHTFNSNKMFGKKGVKGIVHTSPPHITYNNSNTNGYKYISINIVYLEIFTQVPTRYIVQQQHTGISVNLLHFCLQSHFPVNHSSFSLKKYSRGFNSLNRVIITYNKTPNKLLINNTILRVLLPPKTQISQQIKNQQMEQQGNVPSKRKKELKKKLWKIIDLLNGRKCSNNWDPSTYVDQHQSRALEGQIDPSTFSLRGGHGFTLSGFPKQGERRQERKGYGSSMFYKNKNEKKERVRVVSQIRCIGKPKAQQSTVDPKTKRNMNKGIGYNFYIKDSGSISNSTLNLTEKNHISNQNKLMEQLRIIGQLNQPAGGEYYTYYCNINTTPVMNNNLILDVQTDKYLCFIYKGKGEELPPKRKLGDISPPKRNKDGADEAILMEGSTSSESGPATPTKKKNKSVSEQEEEEEIEEEEVGEVAEPTTPSTIF